MFVEKQTRRRQDLTVNIHFLWVILLPALLLGIKQATTPKDFISPNGHFERRTSWLQPCCCQRSLYFNLISVDTSWSFLFHIAPLLQIYLVCHFSWVSSKDESHQKWHTRYLPAVLSESELNWLSALTRTRIWTVTVSSHWYICTVRWKYKTERSTNI